uniref:Zinc finger CCCH domain-containing protein 39 n=1 Tax=Anthurium amnicola TaxID=1678845 RepID=A0A1D1Y4G2_9ARAE
MSTAENPPFFFPPLPPPDWDDGSGFWPQMPPRQEDFETPLFKRQRNSNDAQVGSNQSQQIVSGMLPPAPLPTIPPQNPSQNNKVSRLFFKTRLCLKFKTGSCPYGQNCSFAHGPEELRRAPPNWPSLVAGYDDDRLNGALSDRQRMNKLKICRKYYNGEVCPYGDRCTFMHVEPGSLRESSAISVGITEAAAPNAGSSVNGSYDPETNGSSGSCGDGNGSLQRSSFWKTKMCHKWELTGDCPFGEKCHFAHGTAELKKSGGQVDVETNSVVTQPKHLCNPAETSPLNQTDLPSKQKGFLRLKGLKKIRNIYADWIDDLPPCNSRDS